MSAARRVLRYDVLLARADAAGFVAGTWKRSQRWLGDHEQLSHDTYWLLMNERVADAFRRGARCWVAGDATGFLYGYLVCDLVRVYHCYVRSGFRELGVASALLQKYAGPRVYVCETRAPWVRKWLDDNGWKKENWPC